MFGWLPKKALSLVDDGFDYLLNGVNKQEEERREQLAEEQDDEDDEEKDAEWIR